MIEYKNHSLKKYNTLKIDAVAEVFYLPENEEELIDLLKKLKHFKKKYHILGNGSNVLFNNNRKIKTPVIYMGKVNNEIRYNDSINTISVGCSVMIQKLIRILQKKSFGGMEFLYSVPGTVGGCICMNAGTGKKINKKISDFIEQVRVWDGDKIIDCQKEVCGFDYRTSKIKEKKWIVLSAEFKLIEQSSEITEKLIKERLEFCQETQDLSKPNLGSIFNRCAGKVWKTLKGFKIGEASFSNKKHNWFLNNNNASYRDFKTLIFLAKAMSYLYGVKPELEIIVIDK